MAVVHARLERGALTAGSAGPAPLVPWWSFTKTVIAATALVLVRDGALRLDEAVDGAPYTVHQVLQHKAGLGDYGELADYHAAVARDEDPWPVAELLRRSRADTLRYAPGAGWRYSNIGYLQLRLLIERVTQSPLQAALQAAVLAPLGIGGVVLARQRNDLHGVALGDAGSYHPGWVYHGLLVGSLPAAALLLDRLLGGPLLPPALLDAMRAGCPVGGAIPGRPWVRPAYGLGLMMDLAGPDGPIGHTGGGPGSVVAVYRRQQGGVPVVTAAFGPGEDQGEVERVAFGAVISGPEGTRQPRPPGARPSGHK